MFAILLIAYAKYFKSKSYFPCMPFSHIVNFFICLQCAYRSRCEMSDMLGRCVLIITHACYYSPSHSPFTHKVHANVLIGTELARAFHVCPHVLGISSSEWGVEMKIQLQSFNLLYFKILRYLYRSWTDWTMHPHRNHVCLGFVCQINFYIALQDMSLPNFKSIEFYYHSDNNSCQGALQTPESEALMQVIQSYWENDFC